MGCSDDPLPRKQGCTTSVLQTGVNIRTSLFTMLEQRSFKFSKPDKRSQNNSSQAIIAKGIVPASLNVTCIEWTPIFTWSKYFFFPIIKNLIFDKLTPHNTRLGHDVVLFPAISTHWRRTSQHSLENMDFVGLYVAFFGSVMRRFLDHFLPAHLFLFLPPQPVESSDEGWQLQKVRSRCSTLPISWGHYSFQNN